MNEKHIFVLPVCSPELCVFKTKVIAQFSALHMLKGITLTHFQNKWLELSTKHATKYTVSHICNHCTM